MSDAASSGSSPRPEAPPGNALVDGYDAVLFDLDGVLYRGTETVDGARDAVAQVRRRGARVAFVTNNSSRTPEQVADKLAGHGIDARPEEVVTSAMATADLLRGRGSTAFVVGEAGIREALEQAGFQLVGDDAERADVVVVGVDSDATYVRLRTAALLVQRGARLVATNADASYPAPDGLWPGAGALLAAITTTLGRDADEVVGKPHPPLLRAALERSGGSRPLVVGDRIDTDIDGAASVGWDSLMVLTGVSTEPDLIGARNLPSYLGVGLGTLFRLPVAIRPAESPDAAAIEGLLTDADLQIDGIVARLPETLVAERQAHAVGTVSLELFGTIAHLRSLVVAPTARGERVGTLLTARAVRLALDRGATEIHAVTDTAASFFARLGMEETGPRDSLPREILATPMVQHACATTATAFRWPPRTPDRRPGPPTPGDELTGRSAG